MSREAEESGSADERAHDAHTNRTPRRPGVWEWSEQFRGVSGPDPHVSRPAAEQRLHPACTLPTRAHQSPPGAVTSGSTPVSAFLPAGVEAAAAWSVAAVHRRITDSGM